MKRISKSFPDVFVSGSKTEFAEIRLHLQNFVRDHLGIEINIFEAQSAPGSNPSENECEDWGRECDLMILIAGSKYGSICTKEISFTELEYNAAFKSDPKKIRTFVKGGVERERQQEEFIEKIRSGPEGRRYREFIHDEELLELVPRTIVRFLIDRLPIDETNDIGQNLSPSALKIASYLNKKSKYGHEKSEASIKEDIRQVLAIDTDEFNNAIEELEGRETIYLTPSNPDFIAPLNKLFWITNQELNGWNVKNDAKWLAGLLLKDKAVPHINLSSIKLPEGWNIPRLNAAATFLVANKYADSDNSNGNREYAVTRIKRTGGTWMFCNT